MAKIPAGFLVLSFIGSLASYTATAAPLDTWIEIPKPDPATAVTSVAYGNGLFVAVGDGGTIITSTNGGNWTAQSFGVTNTLWRAKFVNGRFFAIGGERSRGPGPMLVSTNGTEWTPMRYFDDITFANGAWYGIDEWIFRSTDLVNWEQASPAALNPHAIDALGNRLVVRAIHVDEVVWSDDGVNWTSGNLPTTTHGPVRWTSVQNGIVFTPGTIQVGPLGPNSEQPTIFYSNDAATWNTSLTGIGANSRVIAGGTNYVVINRGFVWYTSDLAGSWTSVDVAGQSITSTSDLAFGAGHFVAIIDGRIYRSNPVNGAFPPQIFKQPESFAATIGGAATFTVGAQGAEPITYQWRMNGTNIAGATNSSLTLTNVSFESAGEYDVTVTNPAGTVTSVKGELSINFADVHLYPGITLRGAVGDKFLIESHDKENEPWTTVTNVTLSQSTFIWIDYASPDQKKRLFRVTFQGR